ncbi:MAG: helix-turn-helix domain-containing protein [Bacteroidaceae bacterium]|nr:helix-turn-helix domain-containing protein [Bacteroidaceae bacterium]
MSIQSLLGQENVLLVVTPTQLREFAEEIISNALSAKKQDDTTLLTANEVAELLNVDKSTLWRWEKSEYLKPIRIGSKIRYKQSEVQLIKRGGK